MKSGAIFLFALPFLLTACSSPLVMPSPPTFQSKVTHASDWRALAESTASQFAASHDHNTPVFVAPGPSDMPFAVAFRSQLEEALLQKGFRVVETASELAVVGSSGEPLETVSQATVLRFGVQAFLYKNDDGKPVPYGTALTTAFAAGSQLRHITSLDTGVAIAGGSGPLWDILSSLYNTTKAEVLIDISIYNGTHLEYRNSEPFYIHPSELNFYLTNIPDFSPQIKSQPVTEVSLPVR